MKLTKLEQAAEWLLANDDFTIITHRRPDGDTLGSAAALCRGLRSLGKHADILLNEQTTERYLPFVAEYHTAVPHGHIVAVDIATEQLFPNNYHGAVELNIDHHETNSFYAGQTYVEPHTAACGEIICRLLKVMKADIDKTTAEALYIAVSTDTGGFRFSNTTASTLRTVADLMDCGADTFRLSRMLFDLKSQGRFNLEAYLVAHKRSWNNGKIMLAILPQSAMLEMGATEDDAEPISGFYRNMIGVEIAGIVRDIPAGSAKLSLRTDNDIYSASEICAVLGGGGHSAAAGASLTGGTAEELLERLLEAIAQVTGLTLTEDL